MRTFDIQGNTGRSLIHVGESLGNLRDYVPLDRTVIITDSNVKDLYQSELPSCSLIEIGTGEIIKTLETVETIYRKLLEFEAHRSCFIVGIGGGIVCDIAGFVASTYLRGVRFGFVSTTLLSQVDASVGGKNGVNFGGYKNMVGVFNQPEFVICDTELLKTLPQKEMLCGMAEIVKHGAIADADLFSYLEDNYERALDLEAEVIEKLVYDSVVIKSSIVNMDEKEEGDRKKLNFGHTFGHAIEKVTTVPHGEAIGAGMLVASRLSAERGYLNAEDVDRLEMLLKKMTLPTNFKFDKEEVIDALKRDKKRRGDSIDFVLLRDIGRAVVEKIHLKELEKVVKDLH